MKFKTLSLVALLAGIHSASALSIDFTGLDLDGSVSFAGDDRLVIEVPGFGNVLFGTDKDRVVVGNTFGEPAAEFDSSKVITVEFISDGGGLSVSDVLVGFVGEDDGENPIFTLLPMTLGWARFP